MKKLKKLSLENEMKKEAEQIEKKVREDRSLDDIKVSDEMEKELFNKIQDYEYDKRHKKVIRKKKKSKLVIGALAAVLILPVSMFIINKVMKHSQKYFQAQQEYLGKVNGQVEENFGGHDVVRVFNKEQDVLKEFEHDNQKLYESAWKSQFFSGVMVALLGGIFAIKGTIEVGDIQSFFQYIRNFTQPIQQIAQVTNLLQSSAAASERVFEFLEEPE